MVPIKGVASRGDRFPKLPTARTKDVDLKKKTTRGEKSKVGGALGDLGKEKKKKIWGLRCEKTQTKKVE